MLHELSSVPGADPPIAAVPSDLIPNVLDDEALEVGKGEDGEDQEDEVHHLAAVDTPLAGKQPHEAGLEYW